MGKPKPVLFQLKTKLFGGAERFAVNLLRGLSRELFTPVAFGPSPDDNFALAQELDIEVVQWNPETDFLDSVKKCACDHKVNCIVTLSYRPEFGIAARQLRIPHIWRVPSTPQVNLAREPFRRQATAALASLADAIVCPAEFVKSSLEDIGICGVRLIRNGVDSQFIEAGAGRVVSEDVALIASVGSFYPQKRHEIFIQACAKLAVVFPRLRFEILGCFSGHPDSLAYREQIMRMIDGYDLATRLSVRSIPVLQASDLRGVDIFVHCSEEEGFGNALAESMALGVPVLSARSGGYLELIEDGLSGVFFAPGDCSELANKLEHLIRDCSLRRRLGREANSWVTNNLRYEKCINAYERLLLEVIGKGTGP